MQEPNRDLTPVAASATAATMQRELNEPQPSNRSAWQAIQESKAVLEPLARLGAILLGATYLVGFLIVIQHHATFGIVDVGVFRARVMAAGVLFDFLTLLPVVVASRVYGWLGLSAPPYGMSILAGYLRTRDEDRVFKEIILANAVFFACASLAGAVSTLFLALTVQRQNLWFMLGLIPICITAFLTRKYSFDHVRKVTALAVASTIIFGWSMIMLGGWDSLWRSLWFFGCAMAMRLFPATIRRGGWRTYQYEWNLGLVFSLLLFFSTNIYGTVKFQFGGGAPLPMKLYLVADAPHVFEDNPAKAWLIEQTDQGWYVIQKASDHHSVFVPRALVRVISLGEEQK